MVGNVHVPRLRISADDTFCNLDFATWTVLSINILRSFVQRAGIPYYCETKCSGHGQASDLADFAYATLRTLLRNRMNMNVISCSSHASP